VRPMGEPGIASTVLLTALVSLAALGAIASGLAPAWIERRRASVQARPFPPRWRKLLWERMPDLATLPVALRRRLEGHIQVFLAEKPFVGCQGQVVTDEVRLVIAAHACMLLLGSARAAYYPRLHRILVYPTTFIVNHERPLGDGSFQVQRRMLSGESSSQGQVVLSWEDVLAGAQDPRDGRNVALHEFAHQIDQDKGTADGQPWRPNARARQRWLRVMTPAFVRLQHQPSAALDQYGATDMAEFFAVATESFFECPALLSREEPEVYEELALLYGVDPRAW
jgi:Mlc titration factor MtfA (ptsG expression regulator)